MRLVFPWLLILIVPALALLRAFHARRRRALREGRAAMAGTRLAELTPELADARWRWKALLVGSAVLLIIAALARPQFGTRFTQVKKEGIDIVFAIDTSLSMTAEDLRPNRLERARLEIEALLPRLGGNRVAVVAFAGAAFVQCPLTLDHGALRLFLDALSPDLIPRPGTDLAQAIDKAIAALPSDDTASRVVVLLSDGEGFEGDAQRAAEAAADRDVMIHAVGIGSPEGEPIPAYDAEGRRDGYKKDAAGQTIMSRLDEAALARVAAASGGRYYRVSGGGFALDEVMDEIAAMARKETESRFVAEYEERFQAPLLAALVLLIVDAGIVLARRRAILGLVLLLAAGTVGSRAEAQDGIEHAAEGDRLYREGDFEGALGAYKQAAIDAPERADLEFNVGTALLKLGRTDDAAHKLERAAEKAQDAPDLERDAHYNRGFTRMAAQQFQAAAEAYQAALDLDPGDDDALYNLELALRMLKEQQEQEQEQSEQNEREQEEEEQETEEDDQSEEPQQDQEEEPQEEEDSEDQEESSEDEEEPRPPEPDSLRIDPELAQQILEAIADDEQELHEQRARWAIPTTDMPEKDW